MKNKRNSQIVGKNCASYNDKHPENPIILRPIRAAVAKVSDKKIALNMRHLTYLGKQDLMEVLSDVNNFA